MTTAHKHHCILHVHWSMLLPSCHFWKNGRLAQCATVSSAVVFSPESCTCLLDAALSRVCSGQHMMSESAASIRCLCTPSASVLTLSCSRPAVLSLFCRFAESDAGAAPQAACEVCHWWCSGGPGSWWRRSSAGVWQLGNDSRGAAHWRSHERGRHGRPFLWAGGHGRLLWGLRGVLWGLWGHLWGVRLLLSGTTARGLLCFLGCACCGVAAALAPGSLEMPAGQLPKGDNMSGAITGAELAAAGAAGSAVGTMGMPVGHVCVCVCVRRSSAAAASCGAPHLG
jgi:hypothetical protein